MLIKWDRLPEWMQTEELRPYYDALKKKRGSLLVKRCFDFIAALLLLILLSPAFLVISIVVRCDSPGPVFFRQTRITAGARPFRIFKFRTMTHLREQAGPEVTVSGDRRVTRSGNWLRRLRLDELPQLLNVLSGQMSFVGTRPEVARYVDAYTGAMAATLLLPAGITSTANICYKDEARLLEESSDPDELYIHKILPEKMRYNLEDIARFSIGREIGIMLRTVVAVLR